MNRDCHFRKAQMAIPGGHQKEKAGSRFRGISVLFFNCFSEQALIALKK
jgi:hypothetical protein